MIYFTSDLHFYHENIIKHRPFLEVEEMNRTLIDNWNKKVGTSDEIFILGDVTMKGATYGNITKDQYDDWRYNYPKMKVERSMEHLEELKISKTEVKIDDIQ